jgi:hypothetical protein
MQALGRLELQVLGRVKHRDVPPAAAEAGGLIHVIEQKSMRNRLEGTDVYHCALERARHQSGLHDLR